ncbi:MAG: hypothetical protein RL150_540 [Candidatus Parcubacteria bacterium]|jgi:ABC-type branched-subunit amino acid transport system substrate-binding protein
MTKKRAGLIGGVLVVLLIAAVFMLRATEAPATLRVGVMLPLSGEYAWAGENIQRGIELAQATYVAAHPESQIELIIEDDGFDVQKGIAAYQKLTDIDQVDALIMVSTPVVDALHGEMQADGLPIMQLGIQTVGVAADNIFQTSPSAEAPIEQFATHLLETKDFKHVAVFYDNTAGGLQFKGAFERRYTDMASYFIMNDKDAIRAYALKVAADEYDAVVFLTSPTHGALLVKEILAVDDTVPFFGFDAQLQTGFGDYERILGDLRVLNGAQSLWLKGGDAVAFANAYKEMFGVEPGFFADFGYDTFMLLVGAYDTSRATWFANIQAFSGDTVSGPFSFDAQGVRLQPIVIQEVVEE